MTRLKYIGAAIVLLCFGLTSAAQNISNKGKEFWVAYGHHQYMEGGGTINSQDMTLYLSTEETAATVTVTIDSSSALPTVPSTWWKRTYNIPPYTVINITTTNATTFNVSAGIVGAIPKSGSQDARLYTDPPPAGSGGEGIFRKKGIHIESNVPIVAYAHIYASVSSGATMLLPVDSWGYAYTTINSEQVDAGGPAYSWVYVIAKEDNTTVRITPSVTTRLGKPAGTSFDVTLMRGQIYQIIGQSDGSGNGNQFTGTKVISIAPPGGDCKPIAVFAGSSRTRGESVPCGTGSGRDNDMQQCYPEHAWGKRYLTAPFSTSNGSTVNPSQFQTSVYKIVVRDPATVVKKNGVTLTGLISPGNYYKFSSNTADFIESDKPIMIGQFMSGSATCNPGSSGDPEMVFLSPIEQAIKNVGFYRNNLTAIASNFITMVIPTAGMASLKIEGIPFASHPAGSIHSYPHPQNALTGRAYTVVVKGWASAQAQALVSSDSAFNIITYGLGSAESYAFSGGAYINNLNYLNGLHNIPDTTNGGHNLNSFTGVNTPTKMGILMRYIPTKLTFKFSAWPTAPPPGVITPLNDGIAPEVTAGVDFVMNPVSNYFVDSPVINSIKYYWYQLPDSFRFNIAGTHILPVVSESPGIDNCGNKENLTLNFDVVVQPVGNFTVSHTTKCTKDQITLNGPATAVSGATTYNLNQWYWTVSQGATVIRRDSIKTPQFYLPAGTYTVALNAVTVHGLLVTPTTQTITVYPVPSATFNANPDTMCLNQPVTFSQTSSYGGPATINSYTWNLADGNPTASAAAWTNKTINYPGFGSYRAFLIVGVSPACVSDTAWKTVVVNSQAHSNINYPTSCLNPNGVAQFSATPQGASTVITGYSWTFGDPSSGAANSSTSPAPSHTYSTPGIYQVILNITTSTGCTGADTIMLNANIRAALSYPALPSVCQNSTSVNVATATVTNGIAGTGVYSDATNSTTSAGIFNPSTAGAGPHRIYYTFTTTTGCVNRDSSTIVVNPRPVKPVVTTPVTYCQNTTASPLSATALPGHTLTWYTTSALTGGSATAPTPSTATPGSTKYYVTQSNGGCEGDVDSITVNVYAAISNYNIIPLTQTICEGSVVLPIYTNGTTTGGTGSYAYQWQSSTNNGGTWNDIVGETNQTYTPASTVGTIKYRRKITSGLCSEISNDVSVTVVPEITNFQVSPASQDVCEGTPIATLDGQTPGGAGPYTYQWQSSPDGAVWTNISGATSEDYSPTGLTVTTYFRRIVTNLPCTATSNAVVVNITPNADGNITAPSSICANNTSGASITYHATAGTAPFIINYTITPPAGAPSTVTQNNVTDGATFLVIPAGSPAGTYTVKLNSITNSNSCVRSTGLTTLTINVTAIPVVTVSITPSSTVCEGTAVTITGSGAASYDWGGGNTASSFTVTPAPGSYTYNVTGTTNGCTGNGSGSLTVNPRPAKPTVTSPVTYCQNGTAVALVANASAGNTLKWYTTAALTGGTTTTPIPSTSTAGTTTYWVTQTNAGGCESQAETITVTITPSIAGNDLTPNTAQNLCSGSTPAINAATPTGGTGTYTYQWQSSTNGGATWSDISGATSANLTASPLTSSIRYRRIVTSGLCSNTSNEIVVNVTPALGNNSITASHNICEGIQPNLLNGSSPTGGDGTYTYQWQSSATGAAGSWSNVASATSSNYQSPIITATTHFRRVIVSGACSDTSAPVIITFVPNSNGNIETVPASGAICQYNDGKIKFNLTTGTGTVNITYTITAPGGGSTTVNQTGVSNGDVFTVVPIGSAAGNYTVALNSITNSNNCIKNSGFNTVTITVTATPVVTIAPVSPLCVGGTATLTASGATTYAWTANTPGGTLSSNSGASVTSTPASAGVYNFSVIGTTNGCNSSPATEINVTINPRPVAPTVTSPIDYCQLGTAAPLTGSGAAGNTIIWYDNAGLTGGVTAAPTPSTTNAGTFTYYVTQTNSFSCESTPATITINVAPGLGGNTIAAAQTICQGNTPAPLTNTGTITGGNGTYNYQWQVSTNGTSWTNIPGATSPDYAPGILNDTTWYRRNVTSTLCGSVSNIIQISVFEGLGNYGISAAQTICENTAPVLLDGQVPTGSGPFTYTWEQSTDGGANWTTVSGASTGEDYQPGTLTTTTRYRRKVTNGPCSAVSNEVIITVNPVANGNITAPPAICVYDAASITFHATVGTGTFIIQYNITAPGGSVTASGPVNVTDGSVLNVVPTNSAAGNYTVMLTSIQGSNGCTRTSGLNSVTITVNPRPTVTINPITAICEGESKTITANGAATYAWNPGALTGTSINVTPAVTTTYSVVGTAIGCESNPVNVVLTVNPKPNASFTIADNVICLNETASFTNNSTIDSGSIATLTWDFDNSNVQTIPYSTTPITQTYSTHRTYNVKLTATSDKGCVSDVFTLPISVNPLPVASFTNPAFVCMPNGIATFTNTTTIANGAPLTYTWTFGDPASGASNTSTNTNGSHVYPDSNNYNITLYTVSAEGCSNTISQSFNTFFNKPVAKFGVTPDTLCQGIQNAFFDSSFAPGSTIDTRLWTFGDGTTSSATAPTKTYTHPGNYNVKLLVSNTQGCTAEVNKNIVVYLQPVVSAGPSFIVPEGTIVTFNAQVNSGALSLAWTSTTGGSVSNPSILKPSYIANQDGIFVLTATGEGNCSATDTLSVKILRPITIPNAFSPNGDGVNDTWGIKNLKDYPNAVVEVFNRYGQSVYKQYGYGQQWDGKLNGKDLPVGTYYYIVDPKSGFERKTGYVVIVR